MKCEHLMHKFGGRVLELTGIEHAMDGKRAYWQFLGRVKWDDTGKETECAISPDRIVHGDDAGFAESCTASDALMDYLRRNGKWDGKGNWKPAARSGSEPLT